MEGAYERYKRTWRRIDSLALLILVPLLFWQLFFATDNRLMGFLGPLLIAFSVFRFVFGWWYWRKLDDRR